MIYVLVIGFMLLMLSLGAYYMETLVKTDLVHDYKSVFYVQNIQKERETLLTKLNLYVDKNINYTNNDDIKKWFADRGDFRIYCGQSYISYDKNSDLFKVEYILKGEFYKEESYEYTIKQESMKFGCIDYSF